MNLHIIFTILLTVIGCSAKPVDLYYLKQVPAIRLKALGELRKHSNGSSSELALARQQYFATLNVVFRELIKRYYRSEEFPEELLRSVETSQTLLVNIKSPKTVAQGASGYDAEVIKGKIQFIESIIPAMAKSIGEEAWDWDATKPTKAEFSFTRWMEEWKRGGEF